MGSSRVGLSELEQLRHRRKKNLAKIAEETGLDICCVWRVLRKKCFDIRKIVKVARAIGVTPRRLNIESFAAEETRAPGMLEAKGARDGSAEQKAAGDGHPMAEGAA